MRKIFFIATLIFSSQLLLAQPVDSIKFFTDEQPLEMTLTADLRSLQNQKTETSFLDGSVTIKMDENITITENIKVSARGKTRKAICRIPPMMLNFRTGQASKLNSLGKLKLVIACGASGAEEELLLKELLCYKIYNLLEEKSFRVRLLKVTYTDTRNKIKTFTQYAFLLEDDADMARRNGCKKKDTHPAFNSEATNRETMTMVSLFEYFIGNTDWSVPNVHNIKLVFDKKPENVIPYAVPYDFDYSGLVNAEYAVPSEIMGTEKVTERVYRGFPRTIEELQIKLDIFRNKKTQIYSMINGFSLLGERVKKGMTGYLEEFYKMIENQKEVKGVFIDKARTN
jgi:hypothetical protein